MVVGENDLTRQMFMKNILHITTPKNNAVTIAVRVHILRIALDEVGQTAEDAHILVLEVVVILEEDRPGPDRDLDQNLGDIITRDTIVGIGVGRKVTRGNQGRNLGTEALRNLGLSLEVKVDRKNVNLRANLGISRLGKIKEVKANLGQERSQWIHPSL